MCGGGLWLWAGTSAGLVGWNACMWPLLRLLGSWHGWLGSQNEHPGKSCVALKRAVVARDCGGERRINRWGPKNFFRAAKLQYDTLMIDTRHYTFVQTHRMYDTKRALRSNSRLWVIMMDV